MQFLEVASWGSETEPFQLVGKPPLTKHTKKSRTLDDLWEYASGHLGFYGYLRVANAFLAKELEGMGVLDMVDWLWMDDYEAQHHPCRAAIDLLESEGYEVEEMFEEEDEEENETA